MTPDQLTEAVSNLEWLAGHDALAGIAQIIAERRKHFEHGNEPPTAYEAESALDFGEYAKAGALIAAELDQPEKGQQ